ncbi:pyridoxamine-phosphate oxidase [Coniosporium tulheliwenetii]|uniref:Pyridoxamine-phosphate oxidase n=1 Tax=Coniosporium tulheliwenetii TaxID=3383036 RepID=A0ACC2ZA09_9PEZI|nr:pyridoxamine-phosphate oxidase [Cladosporium sp. JES 115]
MRTPHINLPRILLSTARKSQMSTSAPDQSSYQPSNKRIFAPGGTNDSLQAQQYTKGSLDIHQLDPNPVTQFHTWFSHARDSGVYQPETVTLSTAALPSGKVSARMVYLKELDDRGFVIYSNWGTSRKAADIKSNPYAALTFWWHEIERQVRVEGPASGSSRRSRKIGAWASQQSSVLKSREELEERVRDVEARFEGKDEIPVPEFWGGLRVVPEMVEFWQGRESRLHDRFRYTKGEDGGWRIDRLSP